MNHSTPQPLLPTLDGKVAGAWPSAWGSLPWPLLLEGMGDGLWDWDMVADKVHYSPRFRQLLGYTDSGVFDAQFSFRSHLHPDDAPVVLPRLHAHLRGESPGFDQEYRLRCHSGEYRWFHGRGLMAHDASGLPLRFVGHLADVTERIHAQATQRALDDQRSESQRLEAMGNLAAGVAKTFGQLLDTLHDGLARTRRELPVSHSAQGALAGVAQSVERAQALVQQCLVFSRRQPQRMTVLNLGQLVAQCMVTARATAPDGATLRHTLPPEPLHVLADASQLQQATLALCTHAIHALGGRVGEVHVAVAPSASGTGALLVVHDTGPGIPADVLDRLFEPFFLSHGNGEEDNPFHNGLGLAVVRGVVLAHQGRIAVTSKPGQGTRFELWLPRVATPPSALHPHPSDSCAAPDATSSRAHASAHAVSHAAVDPVAANAPNVSTARHVVYIDDDEAMVYLVTRMLKKRGCRVSSFERAEEALAFIDAHPNDMDLLVTDYNMPGFSGLDVVRRVKRCRPDVPMVITSGHITPGMLAEALTEGVVQVLSKQDSVEDLVSILVQLLPSVLPRC